jgi:hypothetical protein
MLMPLAVGISSVLAASATVGTPTGYDRDSA